MRLKPFRITRKEYEDFRALQTRTRHDWWAVFSVNHKEEVWPFVCYGVTPKEKRQYVPLEEHKLLRYIEGCFIENVDEDQIAEILSEEKSTVKSDDIIDYLSDDDPNNYDLINNK